MAIRANGKPTPRPIASLLSDLLSAVELTEAVELAVVALASASRLAEGTEMTLDKIGRASCRERV